MSSMKPLLALLALMAPGLAQAAATSTAPACDSVRLWESGRLLGRLALPDGPMGRPAGGFLARYLETSFGVTASAPAGRDELALAFGSPGNNPLIRQAVDAGLHLAADLGDEGFELRSWQHGTERVVIVHGLTPAALKYGCQELLFYHLAATRDWGSIDWPLHVVQRPSVKYRGIYMLPCWAAHDSLESWQRVLEFNSELTINRNWFWLDGFPVAGHTGEYAGTALADSTSVQRLIDLCDAEAMKLLIGGGWFTWHHEKAVGRDLRKGIDYYLAYIEAFRNFDGFYIEPTGEGSERAGWREQAEALQTLVRETHQRRPEFEFAIAICKFNNPQYLRMMAELDPKRVYWWWCWGDPLRQDALSLYPSVLRWHTTTQMSDYHGSIEPPTPAEASLAGVATSYDPGQGFGNPWNGWGKLGVDKPRDFDPRTLPYFAHQYYFRERCWNPTISEEEMAGRLQRRLFDADAPSGAGGTYWWLSRLVHAASMNQRPTSEQLAGPRELVKQTSARQWTPRTTDTLARMREALAQADRLAQKTQE